MPELDLPPLSLEIFRFDGNFELNLKKINTDTAHTARGSLNVAQWQRTFSCPAGITVSRPKGG